MYDISVEYAHIYTNQSPGEEQRTSLELLTKLRSEFKSSGATLTMAVMVDDYSFPDPTFDYNAFVAELQTAGFPPDVVLRESQLIPHCDNVLSLMNDAKARDPIVEYIKTKKKYPCSLFIATWYLIRLGHIQSPLFDPKYTAQRLINLLPESFKPFEDAGFAIISTTPFANANTNIEDRFFNGRLIA